MPAVSILTLSHLGSGMTLSPGGGSFWPALVLSHITQWKVMPAPKTCSQIFFLIFRHPLIPLFQQSRKSDCPFLSVKVHQRMHTETSKIAKTPKGPPFETKKNFVSDFAQILCLIFFDNKDFKIGLLFKKNIFGIFSVFFQCSKTPEKFWRQKFEIFWKKISEVALLGLGNYQKEQSHEFWWT